MIKVYPKKLGHMRFQDRQSMQREMFAMLPSFLEDLLQSEDLVRGTATRTKTVVATL